MTPLCQKKFRKKKNDTKVKRRSYSGFCLRIYPINLRFFFHFFVIFCQKYDARMTPPKKHKKTRFLKNNRLMQNSKKSDKKTQKKSFFLTFFFSIRRKIIFLVNFSKKHFFPFEKITQISYFYKF